MDNDANSINPDGSQNENQPSFRDLNPETLNGEISKEFQNSTLIPRFRDFEIDHVRSDEDGARPELKGETIKRWTKLSPEQEARQQHVFYCLTCWLMSLYTICVFIGLIVFFFTKMTAILAILIPGVVFLLAKALDRLIKALDRS